MQRNIWEFPEIQLKLLNVQKYLQVGLFKDSFKDYLQYEVVWKDYLGLGVSPIGHLWEESGNEVQEVVMEPGSLQQKELDLLKSKIISYNTEEN